MPAQSTAPAKIMFVNLPGRPMSDQEIGQIIGRMSRSDEQWNALFQFLQRRMLNALSASTEPRLTEREAGIAAGRVSEITELTGELASFLDAAVKKK